MNTTKPSQAIQRNERKKLLPSIPGISDLKLLLKTRDITSFLPKTFWGSVIIRNSLNWCLTRCHILYMSFQARKEGTGDQAEPPPSQGGKRPLEQNNPGPVPPIRSRSQL
jgi:hypothetical protein